MPRHLASSAPLALTRVAHTVEAVRSASKRTAKVVALAELLQTCPPDDRAIVVPWLSGVLRQGRLGVGHKSWSAVVAALPPEPPPPGDGPTVREVDRVLSEVQATKGAGAVAAKREALVALLAETRGASRAFLLALLGGGLRQGALEGVAVTAVAQGAGVPVAAVRRAHMLSGDLATVAEAAFEGGQPALEAFEPVLFRAIKPMLAQPAAAVDEALGALGPEASAFVEPKLDGVRVQIHLGPDPKTGARRVRVFSRHLREVTAALPEVVEVARALPADRAVLDGEVLAFEADGRPRPFQETMRRFGRTRAVAALRDTLPLSVRLFDLMVIDEASMLDVPLAARRAALERIVPAEHRIRSCRVAGPEEARACYDRALLEGHEGVVVKGAATPYEAGSRGKRWFKVKPTHTVDLVVLAAEWGSGRRRGWLSNLHLGARVPGPDGQGVERFAMIGKTFKGLTDATLAWQTEAIQALERPAGPDDRALPPTVWARPGLVVEVAFNDVQVSPTYPDGVALRFARVRRYRDDKAPSEADTLESIRRLAPKLVG